MSGCWLYLPMINECICVKDTVQARQSHLWKEVACSDLPERRTVGWKLSSVLGIREHWHWHMGSSKPRKQDLGTRPADLYSGASRFLSTGSFSVLGTLPRSWKALVEKLMLALSSFGVCGLLLDCHWQEWLWPFKSLCKQTKAPMQIDKQNQRLH